MQYFHLPPIQICTYSYDSLGMNLQFETNPHHVWINIFQHYWISHPKVRTRGLGQY